MAYFACSKAEKTGTDKETRTSIAHGTISATYIPQFIGTSNMYKPKFRGVIQSDVISGKDVGYVTLSTISDRIKAAVRASKAAGDIPVKTLASAGKAIVSHKTAPAKGAYVSLHHESPGTIKTAKNPVVSKKGLIIGVLAAVILLFIGTKVV